MWGPLGSCSFISNWGMPPRCPLTRPCDCVVSTCHPVLGWCHARASIHIPRKLAWCHLKKMAALQTVSYFAQAGRGQRQDWPYFSSCLGWIFSMAYSRLVLDYSRGYPSSCFRVSSLHCFSYYISPYLEFVLFLLNTCF